MHVKFLRVVFAILTILLATSAGTVCEDSNLLYFKGTIGSEPIQMHLEFVANEVAGSYMRSSDSEVFLLKGIYEHDRRHIALDVFDPNDVLIANFSVYYKTAEFGNAVFLTGKYIAKNMRTILPINLVKIGEYQRPDDQHLMFDVNGLTY